MLIAIVLVSFAVRSVTDAPFLTAGTAPEQVAKIVTDAVAAG